MPGKIHGSLRFNTGKGNWALYGKKLELNCLREKEMDMSTSAVVDGMADSLTGSCSHGNLNLWLSSFFLPNFSCPTFDRRNGGKGAEYFNHVDEF